MAASTDTNQAQTMPESTMNRQDMLHHDSAYRAFVLDSLKIESQHQLEYQRMDNRPPQPESIIGVMIPIISVIAVFFWLWKANDNKKKVRIAMIERGMDPSTLDQPQDESTRKYSALRWGMLLLGAGTGLLVGLLMVANMEFHDGGREGVVIASTMLFGGLGLVLYMVMARRLEKK